MVTGNFQSRNWTCSGEATPDDYVRDIFDIVVVAVAGVVIDDINNNNNNTINNTSPW
jgi:hypothetical protein